MDFRRNFPHINTKDFDNNPGEIAYLGAQSNFGSPGSIWLINFWAADAINSRILLQTTGIKILFRF